MFDESGVRLAANTACLFKLVDGIALPRANLGCNGYRSGESGLCRGKGSFKFSSFSHLHWRLTLAENESTPRGLMLSMQILTRTGCSRPMRLGSRTSRTISGTLQPAGLRAIPN